jgi:hypothetical protein
VCVAAPATFYRRYRSRHGAPGPRHRQTSAELPITYYRRIGPDQDPPACDSNSRATSARLRESTTGTSCTASQSVAITPGTSKTHLATRIAIRACQAGNRVLFATATDSVARLAEAHRAGKLQAELARCALRDTLHA